MDELDLGTIDVTPRAAAALAVAGADPADLLARHRRGDWGEADTQRRAHNAFALRHGHTVTSAYRLPDGTTLLVRTAGDRSATRLLLTAEFARRELDAREGYAAWASSYDRFRNPLIALEQPHAEALLASLPAHTALDAGAGTGRHALALARRGLAVTALDQSPEMLAVARQGAAADGVPLRLVRASLDVGLPFVAASFDLIVCALALCHVPDLAGTVRELARLLRPGGHLLLTDLHPAAVACGWRADFADLDATYLLPTLPHRRDDYLTAAEAADCRVRTVLDLPVRAVPAGYLPDAVLAEDGDLPLCLIVLAQKDCVVTPARESA